MTVVTKQSVAAADGDTDNYANTTWATLRGQSSSVSANGTPTNNWGVYADGGTFGDATRYIYRSHLWFDLSDLPAGAVVTDVKLGLYPTTKFSGAGGGFTVVASTQAASPLVVADYSRVGATEFIDTRPTFAGLTLNADMELTLNAAGRAHVAAAMGGTCKLALRSGFDLDNSDPGLNVYSGFLMNYGNAASHQPYLTITYSVAVGRSLTMPYGLGASIVCTESTAGTKDGETRSGSNTSFALARALTPAQTVDNAGTTAFGAYVDANAGSAQTYMVGRGWLSIDTSALDDAAYIMDASVGVWVNTKWDTGIGGSPALCLFEATHSSPLAVGDALAFGSVELAARIPLSGVSSGSRVQFALNAVGRALLNKTGRTRFCIRLSHDVDNVTPTSTKYAGVNISYSEDAAAKQPFVAATYGSTVGASLDQPYVVQQQVATSLAQPYTVISPRVQARLEQPYLVYNFKAGLRTMGGVTTVAAAGEQLAADSAKIFPTMVRVPDPTTPFGRTIVAYVECGGQRVDYLNPYINGRPGTTTGPGYIAFKESLDLGQTWSSRWTLSANVTLPINGVQNGAGLPFMCVDPVNGDMVLVWYQADPPNPDATAPYDGSLTKDLSYISRSSDFGRTWSTPVLLDTNSGFPGRPAVTAVMNVLVLRNGKWLCSLYGSDAMPYARADTNGAIYTRIMESTDRGATWAAKGIAFPKGFNYDGRGNPLELLAGEAALIELDTGRIFSVARIQAFTGANYNSYWMTYSDDGGATWATPSLAVSGIVNLVGLHQTVAGDVLLAGSDVASGGMAIWQSKDRGATWAKIGNHSPGSGVGNVGSGFVEVLTKDANSNVLFVYGFEQWRSYNYGSPWGVSTIADWGSVQFLALTSAVSDPPVAIAGSIGASLSQPYVVNEHVARSLTQPYAMNAAVGASLSQPYTVIESVGQSVTQPYTVAGAAGASLTQPYTVIQSVGRSVTQPYVLLAVGAVGLSCTLLYAVNQHVARSLLQPYAMTGAATTVVGSSLAMRYHVDSATFVLADVRPNTVVLESSVSTVTLDASSQTTIVLDTESPLPA